MFDCQVKTKDGWVVGMKVLPVPPNEVHVMADVSSVICAGEIIGSTGEILSVK